MKRLPPNWPIRCTELGEQVDLCGRGRDSRTLPRTGTLVSTRDRDVVCVARTGAADDQPHRTVDTGARGKDGGAAGATHAERSAPDGINRDMRPRASRFQVEYTYGHTGGSQTRTRLTTSTTNLYNPATRSETGVLAYLKNRHPGLEITILDLEFQNTTGEPV